MKDLVEYITKNIVTKPDEVVVEEKETEPGVVELILSVNPEDMGLVIGKGGQMIKAIRKLLTVRAMAEEVRVNLQLAEPADKPQELSSENKALEEQETIPSKLDS